jgi:lysophospholipase L1-like esterase
MKTYVIGDSISIQYGPYLKQYLSSMVDYTRKEGEAEALLNLDKPQGANGGDSSMVLSFLNGLAKTGGVGADWMLVNCGLHDFRRDPATRALQVPIEAYEQNLCSILAVIRSMNVKPIWIRTTPCDEAQHNRRPKMAFHRFAADCEAYNAIADRVMQAAKVPSIDLYTFTRNLGPDLYCDHVHFHDHIRQKQAAFIAGWLNGLQQTSRG